MSRWLKDGQQVGFCTYCNRGSGDAEGMSFSDALEAMKAGKAVKRAAWGHFGDTLTLRGEEVWMVDCEGFGGPIKPPTKWDGILAEDWVVVE